MANPKVEAIARAIAQAEGHDPSADLTIAAQVMGQTVPLIIPGTPAWRYYVAIARAVLVAIDTERRLNNDGS